LYKKDIVNLFGKENLIKITNKWKMNEKYNHYSSS